ncbi:hypothetical protein D9M68_891050 [compost metagenome]
MPLDEFAVDHSGVAGSQARRYAEALFDRAHIVLDVVGDAETVVLQMADPGFAAAAIRVAVYVDGNRFGGLGKAAKEAGEQNGTAHDGDPLQVVA